MGAALRDVLVSGHQRLIVAVDLPDPDDRHVVAAAIRCRADLIVTANLRDFPRRSLQQWGIEPVGPDDFVRSLVEADPEAVEEAVRRIAMAWTRSRGGVPEVLAGLERNGLVKTVAALRAR